MVPLLAVVTRSSRLAWAPHGAGTSGQNATLPAGRSRQDGGSLPQRLLTPRRSTALATLSMIPVVFRRTSCPTKVARLTRAR